MKKQSSADEQSDKKKKKDKKQKTSHFDAIFLDMKQVLQQNIECIEKSIISDNSWHSLDDMPLEELKKHTSQKFEQLYDCLTEYISESSNKIIVFADKRVIVRQLSEMYNYFVSKDTSLPEKVKS